jgi:hypothetical protein
MLVGFEIFTEVSMKNAVYWDIKTNFLPNKQTPWPLLRMRTIPTERPPLVDEI